jgi:hypothetical protein
MASPTTFQHGRYMLGDEQLVCEECNQASNVTFWRFEGLSQASHIEMHHPVMNAAPM